MTATDPKRTSNLDQKFSAAAFDDAELTGISRLLGELESAIGRRIVDVISSSDAESVVTNFIDGAVQIADELSELGHALRSMDIDSDVNIDHCRTYWIFDRVERISGLEVHISPTSVDANWLIRSDRGICEKCGRPSGRKLGSGPCQYCGAEV